MLGTILLVFLVLILVGALPRWGHNLRLFFHTNSKILTTTNF